MGIETVTIRPYRPEDLPTLKDITGEAFAGDLDAQLTDGGGRASQPLPIPPRPALTGGVVFAQWLQDQGVPFAASRGAAIQIGR